MEFSSSSNATSFSFAADLMANVSGETLGSSFDEKLFKITQIITGLYLMPVISLLGIMGNIFIVIVYANLPKSSTNLYLITLSLSDILKLCNDFLYFVVIFIQKFDEQLGQSIFTQIYLYSHYILLFTAPNTSWLTCAIAMDRYIVVVRTKSVRKQDNYVKSVMANLFIFAMSAIVSLPSPLFLMSSAWNSDREQLDSVSGGEHKSSAIHAISAMLLKFFSNPRHNRFYNIFIATVKAFMPLVLISYLDYQIVTYVYKNRMKIKKPTTKKDNSQSRLTLMLITIVLTFTVCMFPDAIMTMMNLGYANEAYLIRAIREITDLLLAINSAVTFPICYYYSIQFREQFKELVDCKLKKPTADVRFTRVKSIVAVDSTSIALGNNNGCDEENVSLVLAGKQKPPATQSRQKQLHLQHDADDFST